MKVEELENNPAAIPSTRKIADPSDKDAYMHE